MTHFNVKFLRGVTLFGVALFEVGGGSGQGGVGEGGGRVGVDGSEGGGRLVRVVYMSFMCLCVSCPNNKTRVFC